MEHVGPLDPPELALPLRQRQEVQEVLLSGRRGPPAVGFRYDAPIGRQLPHRTTSAPSIDKPLRERNRRRVHVLVGGEGIGQTYVTLIHSDEWLRVAGVCVGGTLRVSVPESGLDGVGKVRKVEPYRLVPFKEGQMDAVLRKFGRAEEAEALVARLAQDVKWRRLFDGEKVWELSTCLVHPEGGRVDIELLRPESWMSEHRPAPGRQLFLDLPEMGVRGYALVFSVKPSDETIDVPEGEGVVTGRFCHSHGRPGELRITGESEPIGVTPRHLFWSETRRDWVAAGDLCRGETVSTLKGTTTVESYEECDGTEPVYNLEVWPDHVFRVGDQGILVHNTSGAADPNLSVVTADPTTFHAVDCTDNRFSIKGKLVGGVVKFSVVAQLANGQRGAVSGKEFFAAMMANFLPRVTKIEGSWIAGIDLDTNIQQFNQLTDPAGGNLSDADAAKKTWTGQRANDYQFTQVTIIFKDPPNAPGQYIEVIVHFTK